MSSSRSRGDTVSLLTAVNKGDLRTVECVLLRGACPNLLSVEGLAAVHLAAGKESEKGLRCLKLLLQHGADPNLRSNEGLTPLHISALWGCYQNLRLLLINGGNPSLRDQDGNKPLDLAKQEENSRCASLLQEFESQAPQLEYEDLPKFQYSLYSGHSMRDCSFDISSVLSDLGDDPLSSTRQSSLFRNSGINRPSWSRVQGAHHSWLSDVTGLHVRESEAFDGTGDCGAVPPVLSSTRLSVMDFKHSPEGAPLHTSEGLCADWRRSAQGSGSGRKSVTFRDSNEYFPAQSPVQSCEGEVEDSSVDFSQYSSFLDSERMATVLQNQGIDVTSPDEVFVFCRGGSMLQEDLEKTVVGSALMEDSPDDRNEEDDVFVSDVNDLKGHVCSSSGSSKYSSSDSDPYKTAIEGPVPLEDEPGRNQTPAESNLCSIGWDTEAADTEVSEKINLTSSLKPLAQEKCLEERLEEISLTPSPFVTGRTRSRLSRCSQKSFNFSPSLPSTSSLFEETLPTPFRTRRNTPRSPYTPDEAPSGHRLEEDSLRGIDTGLRNLHMSSVQASCEHPSQADTVIVSGSQADTFILPRSEDRGLGDNQGSLERPSQAETLIISRSLSDSAPEEESEGGGAGSGESLESSVEEDRFLTSDMSTLTSDTGPEPAVVNIQAPDKGWSGLKHPRHGLDTREECLDIPQIPVSVPLRVRPIRARASTCPQTQSSSKRTSPTFDVENEFLTSDVSSSSEGRQRLRDSSVQSCETDMPEEPLTLEAGSRSDRPKNWSTRVRTADGCSKRHLPVLEEDFLTSDLSSSTEATRREKGTECGTDSQEESFSLESGPSSSVDWPNSQRNRDRTLKGSSSKGTEEEGEGGGRKKGMECGSDSQEESLSLESGSSSSLDLSGTQRCRTEGSSSGCTPRYSMSRLYDCSRPQTLANLSYTPGGRPMIMDMDEPVEYLYTDTEEGHELIETHVPPTSSTSLSSSVLTSTSEDTVLYDWRSLAKSPDKGKENRLPGAEDAQKASGLTDRELRRRLVELGERPGPINAQTRPLYVQKLHSLQSTVSAAASREPAEDPNAFAGYSPELSKVLRWFVLPDSAADEFALSEQFDQPDQKKKWREGIIKSSFNYLLLDPRVTKNLPFRSHTMTPQECFQTFIRSIFYIGKGKRSRPYSHLYEALEYFRGDKTSKKLCLKVQHILQVWSCGQGVISLHCFQNVIPVEAYTREACLVDAIGVKMLTNQKRGDYYGLVSTWTARRKRELGVHLLYRAMQIFLAEGERQLRPADIRLGH